MTRSWMVAAVCIVMAGPAMAEQTGKPSLSAEMKKLKLPPPWYNTTKVSWNTKKPWKQARLEVRRLLGLGPAKYHEAIKLTCLYKQKNDIGNGHEYHMYLFLGGEFTWALQEHEKFLSMPANSKDIYTRHTLASLYIHFGEYQKALSVTNQRLKYLPTNAWKVPQEAATYDHLGDIHAMLGKDQLAKQNWEKAASMLPKSRQPYGRQDIPKKVAIIKAKIGMLSNHTPKPGTLKDGSFRGTFRGYKSDVTTTVVVKAGKIANVKVKHRDNIPGLSPVLMPKRIIAAQSVKVDCVTGCTITSRAIQCGAFKALTQAGMR